MWRVERCQLDQPHRAGHRRVCDRAEVPAGPARAGAYPGPVDRFPRSGRRTEPTADPVRV